MLQTVKNILHKKKYFFQKTVNSLFQLNPHYQILLYLRCILKIKLSINNLLVREKSRWHIQRKLIEEITLLLMFWREGWTTQVGGIWEHAPFYLK